VSAQFSNDMAALELKQISAGRQHDISECLDNVLFQVEAVAVTSTGKDMDAIDNNVIKRCATTTRGGSVQK